MIYTPEKFLVGFQRRVNNYGHALDTDRDNEYILGFATYKDAKGQIRQETIWNNWKHKENPVLTFDNILTAGFKLVGQEHRSSTWTSSGRSVFCVEDPRGFVLQIGSGNLIEIIKQCSIENGVIQQKCVWSWDKTTLLLVPEGTDLYKEGIESFELKNKKVSLNELKPGYKVRLQTGEIGTWLGSLWAITEGYYQGQDKKEKILYDKPKKRNVFLSDNNHLVVKTSIVVAEVLDSSNVIPNPEQLLNEQVAFVSKQEFHNQGLSYHEKDKSTLNGWEHDYYFTSNFMFLKKQTDYSLEKVKALHPHWEILIWDEQEAERRADEYRRTRRW